MATRGKSNQASKVILGIDPGTNIMGFGVVEASGKELRLIKLGIVKLGRKDHHLVRLKNIFDQTTALLEEFIPDELAIESPFYGKNVQSMLKLGRAQGAAIAACLQREVPITEYAPKKIKVSITGNGNASKESVAKMLSQTLGVNLDKAEFDATDGLAAAVCHHFQNTAPLRGAKQSWSQFVKDYPNRID